MATNAGENEEVVDNDKEVTEADLRDLKYGDSEVEDSKESDETDETDNTDAETEDEASGEEVENDDQAEGEDDNEESKDESKESFVKQFPNIKGETPEEYAKNLEKAYENSTAEFHRLRTQAKPEDSQEDASITPNSVTELYAKQKMDEEITTAYTEFQKDYTQVTDPAEYDKFVKTVAELSNTIHNTEKRLASPNELYRKAAVILDWEKTERTPTKEEKLKMQLKDSGASSKSSTSTKPTSRSKVTDEMIVVNRKMYPGKSDAEIRKELEPYV